VSMGTLNPTIHTYIRMVCHSAKLASWTAKTHCFGHGLAFVCQDGNYILVCRLSWWGGHQPDALLKKLLYRQNSCHNTICGLSTRCNRNSQNRSSGNTENVINVLRVSDLFPCTLECRHLVGYWRRSASGIAVVFSAVCCYK